MCSTAYDEKHYLHVLMLLALRDGLIIQTNEWNIPGKTLAIKSGGAFNRVINCCIS